jgi:hypothetical protein
MAWIRNTLEVGELLVSEALADELADNPDLEVLEGPFPFPMDAAGRFEPAWASERSTMSSERGRT